MANVVLASPAVREFTDALLWYAEKSHIAATRFDEEFEQALAAIADHPTHYPKFDDQHRMYLMQRFPYQVFYRVNPDRILVVAVAHTSREPGYWRHNRSGNEE